MTLTYLNNRYYDPGIGNFISDDPLVGRTRSPYVYAAGNPSTLNDPSGLEPCPKSGCSADDSGGRAEPVKGFETRAGLLAVDVGLS